MTPPSRPGRAAAAATALLFGCAFVPRAPAPTTVGAEPAAGPAAPVHPSEVPATARDAAPQHGVAAEATPSSAAPRRPAIEAEGAPDRAELGRRRARLVAAARRRLGVRFRGDCSAFVLRCCHDAGVRVRPAGPARSMTEALYRVARPVEVPRPGDLAFFHDTYDRNRDHKLGNRWTHVALVESVDGQSVVLIHRGGSRIERLRMNLADPDDEESNDRLRVKRRVDPKGTRYLAGELFAAFGALLGTDSTQMLQAGRAADTSARQPATR